MGIFKKKEVRNIEERAFSYFSNQYYGTSNYEDITALQALENEAVFSAVKLISEKIAGLPINCISENDNGKDKKYFLYQVLNSPNKEVNKFSFWESFITNLLLHGNGYAYIKRNQRTGKAESLHLLLSDNVEIRRNEKLEIEYVYRNQGKPTVYRSDEIFKVSGFSLNGLDGISPIDLHRKKFLETINADSYIENFYKKGILSNLVFKFSEKEKVTPEKIKYVKSQFTKLFGGLENQNEPIIADSGDDITEIKAHSNRENDIAELRKQAVLKVASVYGVPAPKLQILDNANYSNVVQLEKAFYKDCIKPMIDRLETAIKSQLIPSYDFGNYTIKFNTTAILRADDKERADYYKIMKDIGVYSINEIREKENLKLLDAPEANYHNEMVSNFIPVERLDEHYDSIYKKETE